MSYLSEISSPRRCILNVDVAISTLSQIQFAFTIAYLQHLIWRQCISNYQPRQPENCHLLFSTANVTQSTAFWRYLYSRKNDCF